MRLSIRQAAHLNDRPFESSITGAASPLSSLYALPSWATAETKKPAGQAGRAFSDQINNYFFLRGFNASRSALA
ncbi:MAG TPA: hypothetical protein QF550_00820, partial [Arenicellales bacterium]|nr:hypothetical protein [Arenicellales bacterium]